MHFNDRCRTKRLSRWICRGLFRIKTLNSRREIHRETDSVDIIIWLCQTRRISQRHFPAVKSGSYVWHRYYHGVNTMIRLYYLYLYTENPPQYDYYRPTYPLFIILFFTTTCRQFCSVYHHEVCDRCNNIQATVRNSIFSATTRVEVFLSRFWHRRRPYGDWNYRII